MSSSPEGPVQAATALAIRVAGAALVFGLQVLLARLLPEDGYGGFVTLWTWMLALGSFAALGFAESSVRFVPRYHERGRGAALRSYWRFGLLVVMGTGGALAAIAAMLALGIGLDGPGMTVLLVALGLPVLGLEYYLEGVARSLGWFRLAAVPVYILRPVLIGTTCILLSAGGVALTLPVIGAVLIGSMGLVALLMLLMLARQLRGAAAGSTVTTVQQRRLWLRVSLPLLLLSGLDDLASYADVLVLSLLVEPDVVGVYFAAVRALALAGFVAYAMALVSGRRFALDLAVADRRALQSNMLQSTRLTLWATIVAVGLALLAGPLLLGAFGEAFVAGQGVMAIMGAGLVLRAMSGQAGEALIVLGRQREGLLVSFGVLVVTLALSFVLVPELGAEGAAIASATAMACRTAALAMLLWRSDRLRVLSFGLPSLSRA
ncbi:lipopolysaccharide biosynthesis protein [Devosia sediminis]|uniref:Lipopolysaccharide biosynthesis protein n=1 Tax=Devosia sediminis TaxID=2798801 RepID=A0A934IMR2_9HYPH|nr:lipopolysaccharide biosynthesis protein [Devosia sediminis]MBJ3783533.1 lipopolysaccharide biosynthesis protein [Devosia sediminis]